MHRRARRGVELARQLEVFHDQRVVRVPHRGAADWGGEVDVVEVATDICGDVTPDRAGNLPSVAHASSGEIPLVLPGVLPGIVDREAQKLNELLRELPALLLRDERVHRVELLLPLAERIADVPNAVEREHVGHARHDEAVDR